MSIERKDYELEDEVDESPSPFNYKSAEEAGYGKTWGPSENGFSYGSNF